MSEIEASVRLRRLWSSMRQRCANPKNPSYSRYGGRGIVVCARWEASFKSFAADMGPRPTGTTLERIDNDRGYEPGNVRWATRAEQARNRCDTRMISYLGRTQTLSEWAREYGIRSQTVTARLALGWSFSRALTAPIQERFSPVPG